MNINELQDEIIEEFTSMDDWMSRYELLVDYGKGLQPLPDEERTEQNRIDGCQSSVWLTAHMEGDKLIFAVRCYPCARHCCPAHSCSERTHTTRDNRRQSLFH